MSCLHQLRQENQRLEEHVSCLIARRDHLLAINARLSIPLTNQHSGGGLANGQIDPTRNQRLKNHLSGADSPQLEPSQDLQAVFQNRGQSGQGPPSSSMLPNGGILQPPVGQFNSQSPSTTVLASSPGSVNSKLGQSPQASS